MKVDELFLRWISQQDTQSMLKENLKLLLHGEPLTATYPLGSATKGGNKAQSPRVRPGSPPLSSSKLPSPRSPRRPLTSKNNNHRGLNGNSKVSKPFFNTDGFRPQWLLKRNKCVQQVQIWPKNTFLVFFSSTFLKGVYDHV